MSLRDEAPKGSIILYGFDDCAVGHTGESVIYSHKLLVENKYLRKCIPKYTKMTKPAKCISK